MTENTVKTNEKTQIMENLEKIEFPTKSWKKLYSIKDLKGGYTPPFCTENDLMALRMISDDVNNKEAPLNKHPEDYELWKVGEICYETGELKSDTRFLARVMDYLKK